MESVGDAWATLREFFGDHGDDEWMRAVGAFKVLDQHYHVEAVKR